MPPATAGYVLVGGRSSRFGSDKALLDWQGQPLALHVAEKVREAAGSITLVGNPDRYQHLGLPLLPDPLLHHGPLAGLQAALTHTTSAWNLVVACDMPNLTTTFLTYLLETAQARNPDVLLPQDLQGRPEPLCAVYHQRCREAIQSALAQGIHKMTEAFGRLRVVSLPIQDPNLFANLNTPADLPAGPSWPQR